MQPPLVEASVAAAVEDNIEVIQLITNRASAPSLGDFLAELHNSEVLSDITICSEDGQAIRCHKLVLIRWSAPFRRMLCGGEVPPCISGAVSGLIAAGAPEDLNQLHPSISSSWHVVLGNCQEARPGITA